MMSVPADTLSRACENAAMSADAPPDADAAPAARAAPPVAAAAAAMPAAPRAAPAPKLPIPPAFPMPVPEMTPATNGGTRLTSMSNATQKTSITPSSSKFSVPVFILT